MPYFGKKSLKNLAELHPLLQELHNFIIKRWDHTIVDGERTIKEQEQNVDRGVSKTMDSKHLPRDLVTGELKKGGVSWASDSFPYPVDYEAVEKGINAVKRVDPGMQTLEAYMYIGYMHGVADAKGIQIRTGVDWNENNELSDHSFIDLGHVELKSSIRLKVE